MASIKNMAGIVADAVVGKRKASSSPQVNGSKKPKITSTSTDPLRQPNDRAQEAEETA
jgi:hypothetical protein